MSRNHLAYRFLRLAYHHFYNRFAFTYDWVSAVVSRGRWRAWTRTAIPRIHGTRVLEVPCGTGNLLLDLTAAGYTPIALDLSPWMLHITQGKFRRGTREGSIHAAPRLARARVQILPFPAEAFDTIVMTFPPGFVQDPAALAELRRVLAADGALVWVDAGRLLPRDAWSRLLNLAFDKIDGGDASNFEPEAVRLLMAAGFSAQIEWVRDEASAVAVVTATRAVATTKNVAATKDVGATKGAER